MIDTIEIVFGAAPSTEARRLRARQQKDRARPAHLPAPIELDWATLAGRFGADDGQVREIRYANGPKRFGHWKIEGVDVMYRHGKLELRASLPKLLVGRNDAVLTEKGAHRALGILLDVGSDVAERELLLGDARIKRADYAWQWVVPTVAGALDHVKTASSPRRKLRTENVSARGRSLVYGYGGKCVLRWYDKVAELEERNEPIVAPEIAELAEGDLVVGELCDRDVDTLLRYEVQDRRRDVLNLIQERGLRGCDVQRQLERPIEALQSATFVDLARLLSEKRSSRGVAYSLLYHLLGANEQLWPQVQPHLPRNTYYRWRREAREIAKAIETWTPAIPPDAFAGGSSEERMAA